MKILKLAIFMLLISCKSKSISSRYEIEEFSEGKTVYYILESGIDSPGGVFDGIIHQVGWKNQEIVAYVERLSSNDLNGWYILNLDTGNISGPLEESLVLKKFSPVIAEKFYASPSNFHHSGR